MIRLTFGTLPTFDEFEPAFYRAASIPQGLYTIILNDSDRRMLEAVGIDAGRRYDCESLYTLVDQLAAISDGHISHGVEPWTDEQMEWAGGFASSILTTLGFEWI